MPAAPPKLACVAYLNAKPLLFGLDRPVHLDVPSRLLERLADGREDVALLPVIDYQRLDDAELLPVGGIGCDGATLTVRLFSRVPFYKVRRLAVDPDSHTSVALSRIVLAKMFDAWPDVVSLANVGNDPATARLLIGDKVVLDEPTGFPHQLDLGQAWKDMTGLPFVFACWTTRRRLDVGDLPRELAFAREAGTRPDNIESILHDFAKPAGWPFDVARRYLTQHLRFNIGPRQLEAIARFHHEAASHGLIPQARPLVVREVDVVSGVS